MKIIRPKRKKSLMERCNHPLVAMVSVVAFVTLAVASEPYKPRPKQMTLSELVEKANRDAEAYHRKHDVKPVKLWKAKKMTKQEQDKAIAYLYADER